MFPLNYIFVFKKKIERLETRKVVRELTLFCSKVLPKSIHVLFGITTKYISIIYLGTKSRCIGTYIPDMSTLYSHHPPSLSKQQTSKSNNEDFTLKTFSFILESFKLLYMYKPNKKRTPGKDRYFNSMSNFGNLQHPKSQNNCYYQRTTIFTSWIFFSSQ